MTKLEEVNAYTLEELKWYKFWYDSRTVIKPSLDSKFKAALDENSKTEIEFDLDDLKLIKAGANNYYKYHVRDDHKLSIEEDRILDKLDARISFLKEKIIHQHTKDSFNSPIESSAEETVSNVYVDKQTEIWTEAHMRVYTIADIYWINKWCENILKVTDSISCKCSDASREIFKITGKHPEATSNLPIVDVHVFFSLKELKEIRNYASMYYCSNIKTVEARNTLYDINLRIKYLEGEEEKMKKATELESYCKIGDENALIMCECRGVSAGMHDVELRLLNIVRECINHKYDVAYSYDGINTFKGYITHGEYIRYVENDETKFYITIHTPADEGNMVIDLLREINLKTIRFENSILYICKL